MKKLLSTFIIITLLSSCKKENPVCYVCQDKINTITIRGYTVCGEKPLPYYTDSAGIIVFVTCKEK